MSPPSTGPRRIPRVRVQAAQVHGQRILLRCAIEGGPESGVGSARMQLVLRRRGSEDEQRSDLTADQAGTGPSAGIDARVLVTGPDPAVWDVGVEAVTTSGDVTAWDVESVLDIPSVPSVVLTRDGALYRARLRTSRAGELSVVVDPLPPHAEVRRVFVEDDGLVVEADLDRAPTPPPAATASIVATSRERKVQVEAPATLSGSTVQGRIALGALAADVPGTEFWDLGVRIDGGDPLRLGGHLDDVTDKKNAVVYPARELPTPGGGRALRPYFTIHNNLSVRSKPLSPRRATAGGSRLPAEQAADGSPRKAVGRMAHRLTRVVAMSLARTVIRRLPSRRPLPPVRDGRPHVSILIVHAYGMGGTVRTVFNQAAYLSRDHQVEVVSQLRDRVEPFFAVPPGVTLTALDDRTAHGQPAAGLRFLRDRLGRMPSLLVHESDGTFARCSLWTDVQLVRRLRAQRGGILMATRPSLNLLMAQLAAPGVLTVGQEHMNFHQKRPELARDLHREYRRLDALTVLTRGDLDDYRRVLAGSDTCVVRIPNSASPLTGGPADPSSRLVVTAGRLTNQKGFDRLIPAFEQVVREHPDWTLRIYGSGPHRGRLQRMIGDRGLYNNVVLMGRADRMGEELAKASIYVMSSRFEGFPMVLIEAMSKGLALVSFDCPRGPSDLITPGEDGLLVPEGDVDGLARGLLQLVEDEALRRRLGAAAVRTAGQYEAESIGRHWDDLFTRLLAERSPPWWRP